MTKEKWQAEETIRGYRVLARATRSEIIVRLELPGNTVEHAEWGMPKRLGLRLAMQQAALQTSPSDIRP